MSSTESARPAAPPPSQSPNESELRHALTKKLAATLSETDPCAIRQIAMLVKRLGGSICVALLEQTLAIERSGDERTYVRNGSRQRTRGGLWFRLAKERLREE